MVNEYLLDIMAYYPLDDSKQYVGAMQTRVCWGTDEYDALISYLPRYLRQFKTDTSDVVIKLSRLRPTGRIKSSARDKNPRYFNYTVSSYIQGLITRFMARFLASDTIQELEGYKNEFEEYVNNYKDEFPKNAVRRMLRQYRKRSRDIKRGDVKPLLPTLTSTHKETFNSNETIENYCNHLVKVFKMFGFRVIRNNENFKVYIPPYYQSLDLEYDLGEEQPYILTPVGLILLWEKYVYDWTYQSDREIYGIPKRGNSVLSFLGEALNEKDFKKYCVELKRNGLTPLDFICNDYKYIYVLKEEEQQAKDLLTSIKANLYKSYMDEYRPLYGGESKGSTTCIFCGDEVRNDTLCPNCANNVD